MRRALCEAALIQGMYHRERLPRAADDGVAAADTAESTDLIAVSKRPRLSVHERAINHPTHGTVATLTIVESTIPAETRSASAA